MLRTSSNFARLRSKPVGLVCGLTIFTAVASLLLGGGTRAGFLSDAILQLLAVPLLLAALWRWFDAPPARRPRWIMALCLTLAGLPILQLTPLPPSIWTMLPHREPIIETFALLDRPLPWAPASVAPFSTRAAILSLIPPLSVFFATLSLRRRERRQVVLALLPIGVLSVLLGLIQVAQGSESWARFFQNTDPNEAVGFFANRNHLAALLYCMILVAAAWVSDSASAGIAGKKQNEKFDTATLIAILVGVTMIAMLLSGQAMARSRAGIVLTVAALIGAFLVNRADPREATTDISTSKLLIGSVLLSVALSLQFALYRIAGRFDADPLDDFRWTIAKRSIVAAKAYFPFGAGFGTFVPVYSMFERPQDTLANMYVNHAHNDYLEIILEGGVFSAAAVLAFIAWWGSAARRIWRRSNTGCVEPDTSFARAATLIVALLLIHSLVDYPLRTGAMMMIFALSCALMSEPLTPETEAIVRAVPAPLAIEAPSLKEGESTPGNRSPAVPPPLDIPWRAPSTPPERAPADEIQWPDEWTRK